MVAVLKVEQSENNRTAKSEVINGLSQEPNRIARKYFYYQKGLKLFDAITRFDEYYISRVEQTIVVANRKAISAEIGDRCAFTESEATLAAVMLFP